MSKSQELKIEYESGESSEYAPECQEDSSMNLKNFGKNDQKGTEGKWTEEENIKYISFLIFHRSIFTCKGKRKSHRIFKKMSNYIKTRRPRQCRSHYQKLMNRFKNLTKCEKFYMEKYGPEKFNCLYKECALEIETSIKIQNQFEESLSNPVKEVGVQTDFDQTSIPQNVLKQLFDFWSQSQQIYFNSCYLNPYQNPIALSSFKIEEHY